MDSGAGCAPLAARFPEITALDASEAYERSTKSYWSAIASEAQPACVIVPRSAIELGEVIRYIAELPGHVEVAIKSGGHTAWSSWKTANGGVLIDLREFEGVIIDRESSTVSIGAGDKWGDVYLALEPYGLAVAGGRVAHVGVSGLVLRGKHTFPDALKKAVLDGVSYFSEQKGFVCDSVLQFEVVLASGDVVEVSASTNPDLFAALKGGSNNFGIVTKLQMKTFDLERMWGGGTVTDTAAWPSLVEDFYNFSSAPDQNGTLILARVHTPMISGVVANVYSSNSVNVSPVLKKMAAVRPQFMSTIREDTLYEFSKEQADVNPAGARQLFFTTSVKLSKEVLLGSIPLYDALFERLKAVPGFVLSMVFQPITTQTIETSNKIGENALGLTADNSALVIILVAVTHQEKADDEAVISGAQALLKDIERLSIRENAVSNFRYLNYAYKDASVLQDYGEGSVDKLKSVSRNFDPNGFF
ncbi:hypothetical protein BDV96DRAFT_558550 [Lophiotrema nucula]|uniref:FAD-binding PCMH-type domain-containing protein n=1 Tax=Lophiotrema nucula TaxID=690887 RepID=A0A6A5YL83_9PLEO|nr:hypothetical protein BDV96DRAFT_558550 [Lophiotrema nucula]